MDKQDRMYYPISINLHNLTLNLVKITKKSKMLEKRGPILEPFWLIFQSKNEAKKRLRFGIDFQWIWGDFGNHFGTILLQAQSSEWRFQDCKVSLGPRLPCNPVPHPIESSSHRVIGS